MKKILVIAAHPDDEILGVGGTIRRLVSEGCVANCIILGEGLTSRKVSRKDTSKTELDILRKCAQKSASIIGYSNIEFYSLPDNRFDTIPLLAIIQIIDAAIKKYKPDTVFSHYHRDLNIDHRRTFEAVLTACRPMFDSCVDALYSFQIPSSTEWNFSCGQESFCPNFFVDITRTLDSKLQAMNWYTTEIRDYPHPRSIVALDAIAKTWGSTAGMFAAEAFHVVLQRMNIS